MGLNPEVIISSLHHPIRLGKMHHTELLTEAMSRLEVGSCADWMRSRANGDSSLTASLYQCCQSGISPIYSFLMYYYTMPIQRSYCPIFIFVALGKVAVAIDGVDSEIRRKKLHDFLYPCLNTSVTYHKHINTNTLIGRKQGIFICKKESC